MTNYLIPYLFEKRLNPSIEKNGNKVNVIKVKKCHVSFRDVVAPRVPDYQICPLQEFWTTRVSDFQICQLQEFRTTKPTR